MVTFAGRLALRQSGVSNATSSITYWRATGVAVRLAVWSTAYADHDSTQHSPCARCTLVDRMESGVASSFEAATVRCTLCWLGRCSETGPAKGSAALAPMGVHAMSLAGPALELATALT